MTGNEKSERPYTVTVENAAIKSAKRVDGKVRDKMADVIEALPHEPRPAQAEALQGPLKGQFKIPVTGPGGEYRVVYEIDDKARTITVVYMGPREGAY